jgi:type VI secretion system ImpC/EvpB family protein
MAANTPPTGQPHGWPVFFLPGSGKDYLRELIEHVLGSGNSLPEAAENHPPVGADDAGGEGQRTADSLRSTLEDWAARRLPGSEGVSRKTLLTRLGADVAALDELLGRQIDAILHAPGFQRLEGSWRALRALVEQAAEASRDLGSREGVQVRFLAATRRDIERDLFNALEFDQSSLWRKIYEDEFGTPGGTPYGLLVADYEIGSSAPDVSLLTGLAEVACAAFAPLLATPSLDYMVSDSMGHSCALQWLQDLRTLPDFVKWRALREREESRFVALPLPHLLGRLPYDGWFHAASGAAQEEATWAERGFRYSERVDGLGHGHQLWISGAWAVAEVVIREFGRSAWFANISGGGGVGRDDRRMASFPVETFVGFAGSGTSRGPARLYLDQVEEAALEEGGFIPLATSDADQRPLLHSSQTLHRPERFDLPAATANAKVSAMLRYILCASRVAHYIKVIARNKIGSTTDAAGLERFLNTWVNSYVTPDDQAAPQVRARLPLRGANVQVRSEAGAPGSFRMILHLQPHFQLTHVGTSLSFTTFVRRHRGF